MTGNGDVFKILLVEDNLNYRSILKSALLRRFTALETKEASGELDTLTAVKSFNPDLVFMDLHLEDNANGLNLIKKIKSENPELEITVLSAHDTPEYRTAARQIGADFFFSKRTSLKSVLDYVGSEIKRKQELQSRLT